MNGSTIVIMNTFGVIMAAKVQLTPKSRHESSVTSLEAVMSGEWDGVGSNERLGRLDIYTHKLWESQ
jgi:hypothetical protein